ncbi:tRNA (adenosine(37)-N6)-dimethylallyltransferase MiaA [Candidatus Gracilibacteria bacterium]|jgi:tRNA dimethylallyltransferase|nr:tRNA (adenosine(37)-N6)-dimethylallyltransferase MiaA [Candidatus Gracilibacteria bacterium]
MDILKEVKNFVKSHKKPLIVVLGPTASGKTDLSLQIAHEINGEIISTDSRQLYKGLEIGSDIIPEEKREGIPHHMLGISEPKKTITLAEYQDMANEKIKEIFKKKNVPMLVGGTGLYISAITQGYQLPRMEPDLKLRARLFKQAEKYGNNYIYKKLQKLDPSAAKKIHPNNLVYVVRAIEINKIKKENKKDKKINPKYDVFMVGIDWPREKLYERIGLRVDNQLKRGLVNEVKTLMKKGYNETLPAISSLGAKEIIPYIRGESTLEECTELLKKNTRNYAKRQMTWFRRYKNIIWLKKH